MFESVLQPLMFCAFSIKPQELERNIFGERFQLRTVDKVIKQNSLIDFPVQRKVIEHIVAGIMSCRM